MGVGERGLTGDDGHFAGQARAIRGPGDLLDGGDGGADARRQLLTERLDSILGLRHGVVDAGIALDCGVRRGEEKGRCHILGSRTAKGSVPGLSSCDHRVLSALLGLAAGRLPVWGW